MSRPSTAKSPTKKLRKEAPPSPVKSQKFTTSVEYEVREHLTSIEVENVSLTTKMVAQEHYISVIESL
jgi:hypothetical protein